MKFLKGLLVVGLLLLVAFLVMGLLGEEGYKVERTKEVNAPIDVVFEQVSKFNNWDTWSPWKEKDPSATYTLDGEDGMVGTKYAWSGDEEITGEGSMTLTEIVVNEKFGYDLSFTAPWEMSSKGHFSFIDNGETTTVSWIDEGDIAFAQRPMMLFMDLDAMMGPDFERGLFKIDSLSQIKVMEMSKNENIIEEPYPGGKYVGIKHSIKISEMDSTIFGESYGKLGAFAAEKQFEMAGAPCALTFNYDEEADLVEMMIAFPVMDVVDCEGTEFEYLEVEASESYVYKYYGEYSEVGPAHYEMADYLKNNNLTQGNVVIEEYVTDPTTVESYNDVLTNVRYLVK